MRYYKIINGKTFVGIATSQELRELQIKPRIIVSCLEKDAQYIQYGNEYYHALWMRPLDKDIDIEVHVVDVIDIDKDEYDALNEAIETEQEIVIEEEIEVDYSEEMEQIVNEEEHITTTVAYVKEVKIEEMSATCEKIITNGVDIELSDGKVHHFSLSIQDQLNLTTLSMMVASGEQFIPYHADGELCKSFSAEDINTIISTATEFKTYHITYFNSLKAYINSLRSVNTISNVKYGMDIPEKYQSEVLKQLIAQRGE